MADSDGETVLYCATSQLNNVDEDLAVFSELSDYTRIYKYHRRTTMQVSDIVQYSRITAFKWSFY